MKERERERERERFKFLLLTGVSFAKNLCLPKVGIVYLLSKLKNGSFLASIKDVTLKMKTSV